MSDVLSAIGILLAIITLFYDKTSNKIKNVLEKSLPTKDQKIELNKLKKEIEKNIWISIAYDSIYATFLWLLIPTSLDICNNSSLNIWSFDLASTIFIIINCTVMIFLIIAVRYTMLLIKRRKCLTTAST